MVIYLDLDETLVRFLDPLCEKYRNETGKHIDPKQIKQWNLNVYDPYLFKIFQRKDFFNNLQPYEGAIEVLRKLQKKEYVVLCSDCLGNKNIAYDKLEFIEKYFPFLNISKQIIFTSNKSLLKGDLIFDDAPHHLDGFDGIKIINDKPYNQWYCKADYRIYNNDLWDFYNLVIKIRVGNLISKI